MATVKDLISGKTPRTVLNGQKKGLKQKLMSSGFAMDYIEKQAKKSISKPPLDNYPAPPRIIEVGALWTLNSTVMMIIIIIIIIIEFIHSTMKITNHILYQSRKLIIQQPYTRHIVKWNRLSKAEARVMRAWLTQNKNCRRGNYCIFFVQNVSIY